MDRNLGRRIAQEASRLSHEKNPDGLVFDMKPYFKEVAEQTLAKWQGGELPAEITDPLSEIIESNMEHVPLTGDLHSQIKIEAVELLIQQFRADQLDALLKAELLTAIRNTFIGGLKATEAETAEGLRMLLDLWHRGELAPETAGYVTTQVMRPWNELLDALNAAMNPMAHTQSDSGEDAAAAAAPGIRS